MPARIAKRLSTQGRALAGRLGYRRSARNATPRDGRSGCAGAAGRAGRRPVGSALEQGRLAAVDALASGYQNCQSGNSQSIRDVIGELDVVQAGVRSRLLLDAIIAAATADSHVDDAEHGRIAQQLQTLGLDPEIEAPIHPMPTRWRRASIRRDGRQGLPGLPPDHRQRQHGGTALPGRTRRCTGPRPGRGPNRSASSPPTIARRSGPTATPAPGGSFDAFVGRFLPAQPSACSAGHFLAASPTAFCRSPLPCISSVMSQPPISSPSM